MTAYRSEIKTGFAFFDEVLINPLLQVFDRLVSKGATVIVIEHDLDVIRNADYIIDMGPGGGEAGGRIIAKGTPEEIASDRGSITGKYLR